MMECLTAIVGEIAGEIAKSIVEPIKRHAGYFISYNRNIKNLEDENKKLTDKKDEVKIFMNDADKKFKKPVPSVPHWHDVAEKLNGDVSQFLETEIESKKCFNGRCRSPWSRYSLGRKAFKLTDNVTKKLKEAPPFADLAYDVPPPNIGATFNLKEVKDFDSRLSLMNEILEVLRDQKLGMISLCGMGGVGKTTIAKKIVKIVETEKLIDVVVMTTVSQKLDLKKIQDEIIDLLGLQIQKQTMPARAIKLHEWLMSCGKKILIILDDVWEPINFEAIGIPLADGGRKGFNVLLTSRKEHVCAKMNSQKNFRVGFLSNEEAWDLFRGMALAGNSIDNQTAREIADECGGLPIAIVTVAMALKNKDNSIWDDALLHLKKSNLKGIFGMEKDVYSRIELSYNLLENDEAQSLLLLCCMFREDFNVPVEWLVSYGMGLRLFKYVYNLQQARDRVQTLTDNLKESFLLLESDEDDCVKMHDVVRDFAISIASNDQHAYLVSCEDEMSWPQPSRFEDYKVISLICEKTNWPSVHLEFPNLELLQYVSEESSLSNSFFKGMKELKALLLYGISNLPESLNGLKKLRTLIFDGKLPSIADLKFLGDLGDLEILAIYWKNLQELPKEIGLLRHLRLLDLREVSELGYFPAGVLPKLSQLEELYVSHNFNRWEASVSDDDDDDDDDERVNASLTELQSHSITTLHICVPNPSFLPQDIVLASLKRFNIRIGRKTLASSLKWKQSVCIEGDASDTKASRGFDALLRKTEELDLEKVKNLKLENFRFPWLRNLEILGCNELQYLVDCKRISTPHDIELPCFGNLRKIEITSCATLKYLFPLSLARRMSQLQNIHIKSCPIMDVIFYGKEVDGEIEFPNNLTTLEFNELPQLTGLWVDTVNGGGKVISESNTVDEASTSQFTNKSCLNSILFPTLWIRFSKLQELILEGCNMLEVGFPPSVAEQLVQLKTLRIISCKTMAYIMGNDGRQEEENHKISVFSMLKSIHLNYLPELVAFFADKDHVLLDCNSLKEIMIMHCPKIKAKLLFGVINEGLSTPTPTPNTSLPGDDNEAKKAKPCSMMRELMRRRERKQQRKEVGHSNLSTFPRENADSREDHQIFFKILPDFEGSPNIQSLDIRDSGNLNLIHLFAPHVTKLKEKLETLTISISCERRNEIIAKEYEEAMESTWDIIEFPKLREIRLFPLHNVDDECNKTGTFSLGSSLSMPLLEKITVEGILNRIVDVKAVKEVMARELRVYGNPHGLRKCLVLDIQYSDKRLNGIPLVASFQKLEKVIVPEQYSLEEILEYGGVNIEGGSTVTFSNFEEILLEGLGYLMHIFNKIPKEIDGLQKLRKLHVSNCYRLRNVFSMSVARDLPQLQELMLRYCSLKEVVSKDDEEEEEASTSTPQIVFRQLRHIVIDDCSSLECFYGGIYTLKFLLLESLVLSRSPAMERFSNVLVSTPKLKEVVIDKVKYPIKGDLNATIRRRFIDEVEGTLRMHEMPHVLIWMDQETDHEALSKCLVLDILGCGKLLNAIPCNLIAGFQNLKKLNVYNCGSMEEIFEYEGVHMEGESDVTFSHLEEVSLNWVPNLKHIFNNIPKGIDGFQKLRKLNVSWCGNLRNIFSVSVARGFLQLQELKLQCCNRLKEVVAKEDKEEEEASTSTPQIAFPQLKHILINDCSYLECFYSGVYPLDFPLLESLVLDYSDHLKTFSIGLLSTPKLMVVCNYSTEYPVNGDLNARIHGWFTDKMRRELRIYGEHVTRIGHDQLPYGDSSKCLLLDIQGCEKLLNAIPCNLISGFQNLEEINVNVCDSMEEIFEYEGVNIEGGNDVTFSHLEEVSLKFMPNLKHIFNKIPKEIDGFQKLRKLHVYRCGNLRNIFSVSVARGFLQLQELKLERCDGLKEVVAKEDKEEEEASTSTPQIVFPRLKHIDIESCPSLECFYSGVYALDFPSLKSLALPCSNHLKTFSVGLLSTPKLKVLCKDSTKYLVNGDLNATIHGWISDKDGETETAEESGRT